MSWTVRIRDAAKKNLDRLPKEDRERIEEVLLQFNENPFSGDIVKLDSEDNLWRRRVGAYRIKFHTKTNERIVYVYKIERRTSKIY